jgi:hypothetical protein
MNKIVKTCLVIISIINIMACSKGNEDESLKNDIKKKPFHGDLYKTTPVDVGTPIADSLKKKTLELDSSRTVGDAFDSYKFATKKEWLETGTKGATYVDYICWFSVNPLSVAALKEGLVKKGLNLKFVIHESGEAYIVIAKKIEVKSDGNTYFSPIEMDDAVKYVKAIYDNKEIAF